MTNRFTLATVALTLVACDRTHMNPSFGVAERRAFEAQVIDKRAGQATRPGQPLDPEEAAIIAQTYRRSLSPPAAQGEANTGRGSVLVVPNMQAPGMPTPAPAATR